MSDAKIVFWDGRTLELENMLDYDIAEDVEGVEINIRGRGLEHGRIEKPAVTAANQSVTDAITTYINIYRSIYDAIKVAVDDMDDKEIKFIANMIAKKGVEKYE